MDGGSTLCCQNEIDCSKFISRNWFVGLLKDRFGFKINNAWIPGGGDT